MILEAIVFSFIAYVFGYVHGKKKILPDTVGFIHPYPGALGGGELVLWKWIAQLNCNVIIYCTQKNKTILKEAKERFNVELKNEINFVILKRDYFNSSNYSFLTLFGQALGSIILVSDCCRQDYLPEKFIDTTGVAFGYSIAKLYDVEVISYVHYPIISTDMISSVANNTISFNNNKTIANSFILKQLKLYYYRWYANWYSKVGKIPSTVYVNSTWTKNHIDALWQRKSTIKYPPCQSEELLKLNIERSGYDVISVGQFRPEKNHKFQILIFHKVIQKAKKNHLIYFPHLTLIGGTRNEEDRARLKELELLCKTLDIEQYVTFLANAPYRVLLNTLKKADIGLHTMENEHFGIGIIEYMFSGCIVLAHNSGGPKLDIITDSSLGFLATSEDEYASTMYTILFELSTNDKLEIRKNARDKALRNFSCFTIE